MTFLISVKPAFLADLLNLNRDLQQRVNTAIDELVENADTPRGDTIKKLRHHRNLWRYRISDYRLVYAVYPGRSLLQLLASARAVKCTSVSSTSPTTPSVRITAVNDTKDNDTIAAIVGAAVGALHGRAGLPARWVDHLLGRTGSKDDNRIFELIREPRNKFLNNAPLG